MTPTPETTAQPIISEQARKLHAYLQYQFPAMQGHKPEGLALDQFIQRHFDLAHADLLRENKELREALEWALTWFPSVAPPSEQAMFAHTKALSRAKAESV